MVFFYQRFINLNYRVENSHSIYVIIMKIENSFARVRRVPEIIPYKRKEVGIWQKSNLK